MRVGLGGGSSVCRHHGGTAAMWPGHSADVRILGKHVAEKHATGASQIIVAEDELRHLAPLVRQPCYQHPRATARARTHRVRESGACEGGCKRPPPVLNSRVCNLALVEVQQGEGSAD